jgi:hypothetical protein
MKIRTKHRKRATLSPERESLAIDLLNNPAAWLPQIPALTSKLRSFPAGELETFYQYLLDQGEEPLLPLFEAFAGKDEVLDQSLARGLGSGNSPLTSAFLNRWAARNPSKNLSKEIRKSLFRLKSKGVPVGESEDSSLGVFRVPRSSSAEGYLSAIDATGSRLVWIGRPQSPQGVFTISSLISDTEGILDFQAFESSRKKFHEYMDQMQKDLAWKLVKADSMYCAGLIQEAHAIHIQKGKTPHPEYLKCRILLEASPPLPLRPLIYQHLAEEEIKPHSDLSDRSPSLFQTPFFEMWYLGKEEMQRYADLLEEASRSRIILAPHQKEGRFFELYHQAVRELFDEKRRRLFRRRLEEMAYLLWQEGAQMEARISLAAALEMAAENKVLSPHPFLLELVKRSLIALMDETREEKQKEKQGGLIIHPG